MNSLLMLAGGRSAIPATTAWYLDSLAEFRGKQELYTRQSPQKLRVLREHALIESAVSSNRIEGVIVAPSRVQSVLVAAKPLFRDRDEEEVRGYQNALRSIHEDASTGDRRLGAPRLPRRFGSASTRQRGSSCVVTPQTGAASLDAEVLIAAQAYLAGEGAKPNGAGRRMGNVEESVVGLRVQVAVVLFRTAMRAVVGEAGAVGAGLGDRAEPGPGCELPGQRLVDCEDVHHGELRQRLTRGGAALAINADDFERLPAIAAGYRRGGDVCLLGDDRELARLAIRAEPPRKPPGIVLRLQIPALEALVPVAASALHGGILFGRDVKVCSSHGILPHPVQSSPAILHRRAARRQAA